MEIHTLPALSDNYIFLIEWDNKAAVVDPAEAGPVLEHLQKKPLQLLRTLITHHHFDHVGGTETLKKETGCEVIGPDDPRVPALDHGVSDGEELSLDGLSLRALTVPGHTSSHVAYFLPAMNSLFCGDTLFTGGCGRLFEGSPEQMLSSLKKLMALPDETLVYCAHEYTLTNLRFALSIEPDNDAVRQRLEECKKLRAEGRPTIPATLAEEKKTNPFLRANDKALRQSLAMEDASDVEVFAMVRRKKDSF